MNTSKLSLKPRSAFASHDRCSNSLKAKWYERREKEVPNETRGDIVIGLVIPVVDVEATAVPVRVDPVTIGRLYYTPSHLHALRIERKLSLRCI